MDGGVGGSTGETTCGVLNLLTVWPSTWVIRHRGEGALHRHSGGGTVVSFAGLQAD